MIKTSMYRYLGRNGIITSPVFLDKIESIPMYSLKAEQGKILTNGEKFVEQTLIFAEDLSQWIEIDNPNC